MILVVAGAVFLALAALASPIMIWDAANAADGASSEAMAVIALALIGTGAGVFGALLRHWN